MTEKMIKIAVLLCFAIVGCFGQTEGPPDDGIERAIAPFCPIFLSREEQAASGVDTDDIVRRLESGELSPDDNSTDVVSLRAGRAVAPAPDAIAAVPIFRCENGPRKVIHTVPGEFHWPPISRGSCDNLFCRDPPCIARKKVWRATCVWVFKIINGHWVFLGRKLRWYLDHKECGCKTCNDIPTERQCAATRPCPNSNVFNSFCYWTKKCECCTPFKCPSGQIFNFTTCQCDCPKGSTKNSAGNCVGDCDDISPLFCPTVLCADNKHLKCQLEGHRCVCPSCEDVSGRDCTRTRCLEQRTKPHCKVDQCTKKCRCPNCEDAPDREWCARTYCGPNFHLRCRWNPFFHSCSCPH